MSGNSRRKPPKLTRGKEIDRGPDLTSPTNTSPSPSEDVTERPTGQINFEFLNFSHPSDAKASGARRTVRSHVTRQQHQREQHAAAAAARSSRLQPQNPEASFISRPPRFETHLSISSTEGSAEASPLQRRDSEAVSLARSTTESPLRSPNMTIPAHVHPFDIYSPEVRGSIPYIVDYCEYISGYMYLDPLFSLQKCGIMLGADVCAGWAVVQYPNWVSFVVSMDC